MKRVPTLTSEPPGLSKYVQEHPGVDTAPVEDAYQIWEAFRNNAQVAFRELRAALLAKQQGLCGYCEQRLSDGSGALIVLDQQVEHVIPKSSAPGQVLDWSNFILCCCGGSSQIQSASRRSNQGKEGLSCGEHKGSQFLGSNCDPRGLPVSPQVIEIGPLDGRISVVEEACANSHIDVAALENTINKVLNLNCERLRNERRLRLDHNRNNLTPLLSLIEEVMPDTSRYEAVRDTVIAEWLRPDSFGHLREFWSCDRTILGHLAETWLNSNLAVFNW